MIPLFITCIIVSVSKVSLADETKIFDYFDSDTFKTIQDHWQTERKAFETALTLILQQDYGHEGMNVYVRSMSDPYKLSDGFLFSDNIVNLVLLDTRLQMLPSMMIPEVTFALASNYLYIEAELRRMVLTSNYLLIRNQSDIVFTASEQDAKRKSPFSFQQVQDSGELTIIAQDCSLTGYTISSFVGNTVNLGLDTFKVTNCKFSIEIYSSELGSPPVLGPYFSKKQSLILEAKLSIPIRAELVPKLQAAVFSYVNTSAIFGDKLPELTSHQNSVFKETSNYMSRIVGNFVQNTIKETQGILQLKPLEFLWSKACSVGICANCVKLRDVTLYGLDTAYSAHIGGPFKLKYPNVAEEIRFSTMQVRGNIYFDNTTVNGTHDFAVELRDVAVSIEMKAKAKSFVPNLSNIYVTGWRSSEFSILEMYMLGYERRAAESFIMGYLINEIPQRLLDHITKAFRKVSNRNEQHLDKTDAEKTVDESVSKETNANNKQKKKNDNTVTLNNVHQSGSSEREQSAKDQSSVENRQGNAAQSLSNASDNEVEK